MKKIFFFLFLSFSVVVQSQTEELYFARALAADMNGDYDKALDLISKAIELDSTSSINFTFRASVYTGENNVNRLKEYYTEENFNKAMADLDMALILDPADELNILTTKAKILLNFERYDEAESILNRIGDHKASDYIRIYYFITKAMLRYKTGDMNSCFDNMDRALEIDSTSHLTLNQQALFYLMEDERSLAIPIINRILSEDPENKAAHINISYSALLFGKYEKALSWTSDLIEKYPEIGLLHNNRGAAHYHLKNYDQALKDINHSLELSPANALAYINRAKVKLALSKNREACVDLEIAKKYRGSLSRTDELFQLLIDHCIETNKKVKRDKID